MKPEAEITVTHHQAGMTKSRNALRLYTAELLPPPYTPHAAL